MSEPGVFVGLTLALGLSTFCMFKLTLSLGSEEIFGAPPELTTARLLVGALGGIAASAIDATLVKSFRVQAGIDAACAAYGTTLVAIMSAFGLRRSARSAPGEIIPG